MGWYLAIKFLHVITAMMFVGGIFGRQLVRAYAKKTDNVQIFAALNRGAGRIENIMIIPGNLAVILFGIILALLGGYPLFGFLQGASQNWLLVSNILLIVGLALVPTVFIPSGKKFDPVLEAALAEGRMTPGLRLALEDKVVKLAHLYEEISIIIVVALMVFKPF
jgi:uncharacterized membrane protein